MQRAHEQRKKVGKFHYVTTSSEERLELFMTVHEEKQKTMQ